MHIIGFSLGAVAIAAIAGGVAFAAGLSGWAATGLGAASFGLAQVLYLGWIVWMARAEARRQDDAGADSAATKPHSSVVQKG